MSALERKRDVDRLEKNVAKWFSWQGRLVAKKLPSLKKYFQESAVSDIDSILDGAFKTTINDGERFIVDGLRDGVEAGWDDLADELSMQKAFALDDPKATAWAKERAAEAVTEVNDTTKETIRNMVSKGIEEGKDYDTVAKQISKRFSEFAIGKPQEHIQSRAHLVAINENAVAYEHGQRELVDEITDAGIDMEKSWKTSNDSKVSTGCARNQAEEWIPADAQFSSGNEQPPRFPGCRCGSRYRVARGDEDAAEELKAGKPVKKPTTAKAKKTASKPKAPSAPKPKKKPPVSKEMTPQEWANNMTLDENEVLAYWQKGGYTAIRDVEQTPAGIAISKKVGKSVKQFNELLDKAPNYKGTVYRGLHDLSDDSINAMRDAAFSQKPMVFNASSSSSMSRSAAAEFCNEGKIGNSVMFEIKSKTGVEINGASLRMYANEKEIILRRGTRYRVTDLQDLGDVGEVPGVNWTKIVLEEI